jgi:hypothetical protein
MAIGTPQPTVDEMVAPQGRDIILFAEGEARGRLTSVAARRMAVGLGPVRTDKRASVDQTAGSRASGNRFGRLLGKNWERELKASKHQVNRTESTGHIS